MRLAAVGGDGPGGGLDPEGFGCKRGRGRVVGASAWEWYRVGHDDSEKSGQGVTTWYFPRVLVFVFSLSFKFYFPSGVVRSCPASNSGRQHPVALNTETNTIA